MGDAMNYREHRHPTRSEATLVVGHINQRCIVSNISSGGAAITGACELEIGSAVSLKFAGGRSDAVVRWANGRDAGVAFNEQICPTQINSLRYTNYAVPTRAPQRTSFRELR